jgi:hypothetical protein
MDPLLAPRVLHPEPVDVPSSNLLPTGLRATVALFVLCALYLAIVGLLMLAHPGLIGMSAGAPLLFGLELAGPYMFLLMAFVAGGIAFGLARRINLVRHAAILTAVAGIVMLVPPVSAAAIMVQPAALVWGGFGIVVRVMVAWYLARGDVSEIFRSIA